MMRALLALSLVVGALACSEPSELRPIFESLENLPGLPPATDCSGDDCCLEEGWCLEVETLSLRNLGGRSVTLSSLTFAADSDESFTHLEIDAMTVAGDEQANVRFRYTTPGGVAQEATIVIESDAEVNPTLEVPVQTLDWVPPSPDAGPPDAGPSDDAGPEGDDAGPMSDDAGPSGDDAGPDGDDAGPNGDDAGA